MTKEDLKERLRGCNNKEIKEAIDRGWEPPPLEDAINWWETIVTGDPHEHIENILALAVEHSPPLEILSEVFGFYECSSKEFLEELTKLKWESEQEESQDQKQFLYDMVTVRRHVRFYSGRFHYEGWATVAENFNDIQKVIRATSVTLQWDQLGKDGYIVYPQ